jgi:hypothetical protein
VGGGAGHPRDLPARGAPLAAARLLPRRPAAAAAAAARLLPSRLAAVAAAAAAAWLLPLALPPWSKPLPGCCAGAHLPRRPAPAGPLGHAAAAARGRCRAGGQRRAGGVGGQRGGRLRALHAARPRGAVPARHRQGDGAARRARAAGARCAAAPAPPGACPGPAAFLPALPACARQPSRGPRAPTHALTCPSLPPPTTRRRRTWPTYSRCWRAWPPPRRRAPPRCRTCAWRTAASRTRCPRPTWPPAR